MAITADQARVELAKRELAKREAMRVASPEKKSIGTRVADVLGRVDRGIGNVVQTGMEAASLPLELAGEAIRVPIEQGDGFRAPSLVQRFLPSTRTEQKPSIGVDVANKLIRAGGGFVYGLPGGLESAKQTALSAYNAPRGALGAVEDVAGSLLLGKIPAKGAGASIIESPQKMFSAAVDEIAKPLSRLSKSVAQGAVRVTLGPTAKQQSLLFNRPNEVKNAPDFGGLSDEFAHTMNDLSKKVGGLDDMAWDSLLKLKAEPKSKIINILKSTRRELVGTGKSKISDADAQAIKLVDRYIDRVSKIRQPGINPKLEQMLDQTQLRDIVQSVRRDAVFGVPGSEPTNLAILKIQNKLDDLLKTNGNYAKVMDELAPATKALKQAVAHFNLKLEKGIGYVPTNATAQKLSAAASDLTKRPETRKIFEAISKKIGVDFIDRLELVAAKDAFSASERARGSARTVLGAAAGLALEPFIPGTGLAPFIGGAVGRSADVFGGPAAGKLVDAARSVSRLPRPSIPPSVSRVAPAFGAIGNSLGFGQRRKRE